MRSSDRDLSKLFREANDDANKARDLINDVDIDIPNDILCTLIIKHRGVFFDEVDDLLKKRNFTLATLAMRNPNNAVQLLNSRYGVYRIPEPEIRNILTRHYSEDFHQRLNAAMQSSNNQIYNTVHRILNELKASQQDKKEVRNKTATTPVERNAEVEAKIKQGEKRERAQPVAPPLAQPVQSPLQRLNRFLELHPSTEHGFLTRLSNLLDRHQFFDKNEREKVYIVHEQRAQIYPILRKDWRLGDLFLERVINNNHEAQRVIYSSFQFSTIHALNQMRRVMIDEEMRRQTPIEEQQKMVLTVLQVRFLQQRPRPQARYQQRQEDVPVQPAAKQQNPLSGPGLFTQALERANDEKDLIPQKLICPISGGLFVHPVKLVQQVNGKEHVFYFEKDAIEKWLAKKQENPMNREHATLSDLQDAPEMKAEVDAFKREMQALHGETIRKYQTSRPGGGDRD